MLQRGRYPIGAGETELGEIEVLTKADLAIVLEKRPDSGSRLQKLRDSHHMLARMVALGKRYAEAGRLAGYAANRVSMMMKDPTFVELVDHYRAQIAEGWKQEVDEFTELAVGNMVMAERMLRDKLEAADEDDTQLPTRDLISISRDAADRFGYGKRSTKDVNLNTDFATQLEKTIARSDRARLVNPSPPLAAPASPVVIEATPEREVAPPPRRRAIA